jgi:hypothetical protein
MDASHPIGAKPGNLPRATAHRLSHNVRACGKAARPTIR